LEHQEQSRTRSLEGSVEARTANAAAGSRCACGTTSAWMSPCICCGTPPAWPRWPKWYAGKPPR